MARSPIEDASERQALLLFERLAEPEVSSEVRRELIEAATAEVRIILLELEEADRRADPQLLTQFIVDRATISVQPQQIGPYRLVEQIGEGGMGEVWRAERADGLFDQVVAIKLLRRMIFSAASLAQFADERRIFARLRHPHVAQMFDGGVTANGVPYIIMELIAGDPITLWADRKRLSLVARIALLCEAAEAIGHAHRSLVVHADIKPSNVVVEEGFGVKLLDFGIARLLDDAPTARGAAYTQPYASPARIAGHPATTADDMFAVGTILRELVEFQSGCNADLVAIADKAAATDPDHRYGTMAELVGELRRWHDHRPIGARPATRARTARLFMRRNWLAVAFGAVVSLALLMSVAAITISWLRADRARVSAEQRFRQTRAMANYMLTDVDPQLARLPGTLPLRRELVARGRRYLEELERDPNAGAELDMDVAAGYLRLARIYGLDVSGGLGDMPAARTSLERADALIEAAAARRPGDPRLLLLSAQRDLVDASDVFVAPESARLAPALAGLKRAQRLFARYLRAVPGDVDARLALWRSQVMAGRIYTYRGQPMSVRQAVEPTLGNARLPIATPAQRADRDFILNGAYLMLAESYMDANPSRAYHYLDLLAQSVGRMQADGASDAMNDYIQATAFTGEGQIEANAGHHAAAKRRFVAAIHSMDRLLAAGPNQDVAFHRSVTATYLAESDAYLGNVTTARKLLETALSFFRGAEAAGHGEAGRAIALTLKKQSDVERRVGNTSAACAASRAASAQWATLTALRRIMAIDLGPGGPIDAVRISAARCRR